MKKILSKILLLIFHPVMKLIRQKSNIQIDCLKTANQISQQNLIAVYEQEITLGKPAKKLHKIGFQVFSQNSEDGVLLYLFSRIGTLNKTCVDIGCAYPAHSNTTNLILNHDWHALLIDADKEKTDSSRKFYEQHKSDSQVSPVIVHKKITRINVNQVIKETGFQSEIDLLSIDIDSMDYWIWRAIDIISPRVVVVEIQCIWGSRKSVTVPYTDEFIPVFELGYGIYNGASLAAFQALAAEKNYRFVGVENKGYNAFFVRNNIPEELIPAEDPSIIDSLPFVKWTQKKFLSKIENMDWEEV